MLFDEVLAVGDARFREKCAASFERLKSHGRTGILVTHSMPALVEHCKSGILLENGKIVARGEPEQVAEQYTELQGKAPKAAP
jgi:ABC-type polysaccharide/polyol phosphate transport system ATPase subunit